jgi:hypothetical protein
MRARHRLSKLLLRHGIVYSGGKAWTELHDRWLHQQRFDSMPTQVAFDDAYETVVLATARRTRLDEKIIALAGDSEFTPVTRRLACLPGRPAVGPTVAANRTRVARSHVWALQYRAVAYAEQYNETGHAPLVDLWPDSRLETLLSTWPGLRPSDRVMPGIAGRLMLREPLGVLASAALKS